MRFIKAEENTGEILFTHTPVTRWIRHFDHTHLAGMLENQ
jgi:hypothetical protein